MTYRSTWWSVELPPTWRGDPDGDCSTFRADATLGVLQISAARKDKGIVIDDDLKEFAYERVAPDVRLEKVTFGAFCGFTARYAENGLSWQEWWLRLETVTVYVTYNVVLGNEAAEQDAVTEILTSLRIIQHK
jgi:hypothetical protein